MAEQRIAQFLFSFSYIYSHAKSHWTPSSLHYAVDRDRDKTQLSHSNARFQTQGKYIQLVTHHAEFSVCPLVCDWRLAPDCESFVLCRSRSGMRAVVYGEVHELLSKNVWTPYQGKYKLDSNGHLKRAPYKFDYQNSTVPQ